MNAQFRLLTRGETGRRYASIDTRKQGYNQNLASVSERGDHISVWTRDGRTVSYVGTFEQAVGAVIEQILRGELQV